MDDPLLGGGVDTDDEKPVPTTCGLLPAALVEHTDGDGDTALELGDEVLGCAIGAESGADAPMAEGLDLSGR